MSLKTNGTTFTMKPTLMASTQYALDPKCSFAKAIAKRTYN